MGCGISKMYEDEEEYEALCKSYGEKMEPRGVLSEHHRFLRELNSVVLSYKTKLYREHKQAYLESVEARATEAARLAKIRADTIASLSDDQMRALGLNYSSVN